jgi:hypothetical protein
MPLLIFPSTDPLRVHLAKGLDGHHLFAAAQPSIEKSVTQPISSQFHKVFNYSKVMLAVFTAKSDTTA